MNMPFAVLALALGGLGAFGVFAAAAPFATSRAEDYPIRWTEHVELNSLDEIDTRLNEKFEDLILKRFPSKIGPAEKRLVTNCNEFFAAVNEGFSVLDFRYAYSDFAWARVSCTFLSKLRSAKPAKISFVRDFRLDEMAPNFLPPRLEFDRWNSDQNGCYGILEYYPDAVRDGLSWATFHRLLHQEYWRLEYPDLFNGKPTELRLVKAHSPHSSSYAALPDDHPSRINIDIWAWADFTGDGVEDLFLVARSTIFSILSRDSHDTVLTYAEPPLFDDTVLCQ